MPMNQFFGDYTVGIPIAFLSSSPFRLALCKRNFACLRMFLGSNCICVGNRDQKSKSLCQSWS